MLTPAEAEAAIAAQLGQAPDEELPLAQCAGRVLRQAIHAERDAPPFDRVAMDGIAIRHAGLTAGRRQFRIAGQQAAGQPPLALASDAACIEVMTGAVLPAGADTVVPVEGLRLAQGQAWLGDDVHPAQGAHIHRRASDRRQGDCLLTAGQPIGGPEIAIAASAGLASLRVSSLPRIAVVSTGDELVPPGVEIQDYQVRRSNAPALAAALQLAGFAPRSQLHLPDEPVALRAGLAAALADHDLLVISGGVSAGRKDLVPATLAALGVGQVFHKVAQRPGKPLWFGTCGGRQLVFGLPGNPVSVLVCLARYVLPALRQAAGLRDSTTGHVALAEEFQASLPLAVFLPVSLEYDASGRTRAIGRPTGGSGDLNALAGTDGIVELPPAPARVPAGSPVALYRW